MPAECLPLVIDCPSFSHESRYLDHSSTGPILQVQMDTLGGQTYLVPLSVQAGIGLLVALSNWQPIQDYLSGSKQPEPPKIQ